MRIESTVSSSVRTIRWNAPAGMTITHGPRNGVRVTDARSRAVEEVALPPIDDDELVDVAVAVDVDLDRRPIPRPAARDHHEEAVVAGIEWEDVAVLGLLVRR